MRFQRILKTKRPFDRGYFAPSTERVNTDQPIFQIGGNADILAPTPIHTPEFLKVKARLNPMRREGENVFAVVEKQGVGLRSCPLYKEHEDCQYQSIQLVFDSFLGLSPSFSHLLRESRDPRNKSENDKMVLFEKQFITQQNDCVLKQAIVDRKLIITPPGKENGQPLWGYGGYYKVGCDLKKIEQMFFTPVGQMDQTEIHLTKASAWIAKGILPSRQSDVVFMDVSFDEEMMNFVGDIEKGEAILTLSMGIDETGIELMQEYRSIAIQQEDALTGLVEVVFRSHL